jgi:hypothetical protein
MTTRISNASAAAAVNAVVDLLDGGAGAGYIEVRTGAQPASVGTAASGTLLATLTLSDPAFGNATSANPAVATADTVTSDTNVDATGTAGWFRAYDSAGTAIIDGSVTATGGGGDMTFDTVSFVAGGTAALTSWTVSLPTGA